MNQYECWCYIYLSAGSYNVLNSELEEVSVNFESIKYSYTEEWGNSYFYGPAAVLCFPVAGDDYPYIFVSGKNDGITYTTWITSTALSGTFGSNGSIIGFATLNPKFYANVYSIKLSIKPPFDFQNLSKYPLSIAKDSEDVVMLTTYSPLKETQKFSGFSVIKTVRQTVDTSTRFAQGLILITADYDNPVLLKTDINLPKINFNSNDVKNSVKNKTFNPKLNGADYKDLTVSMGGDSFNYPIDKLNTEDILFEYFEVMTPDTTKGFLRVKSKDKFGVFNDEYSKSFNGFSFTNDFCISFATSQYATFIANNKNAYFSFQAQQNYARDQVDISNKYLNEKTNLSLFTSGTQGLSAGLMGDYSGVADSLTNMSTTLANAELTKRENIERTELSLNYQKAQFDMSIDNMKNAPYTLSSINGNAIFISMIAAFGIYAELYEGLDTELESANDIMFRDGFNLNRFAEAGKTIKDYCHTRKFFNYIRATLGNISGVAMSDTMRADLKQRFSNGIRFWHQDKIDYSMENYELKLEENEN